MTLDEYTPDEADFTSPDDDPTSGETGADDTENQSEVEGEEGEGDEPELDENGEPIVKAEADEDDEFDEIEHAGKKHKIPKDLRPLLMMQQDYTRKTQEVAEGRKALDEARAKAQAELAQQAEMVKTYTKEVAQLHNIDDRLAQYANVDWKAWEDQNYMEAQAGFREFTLLERQRNQLANELQQKQSQARQASERKSREEQQAQKQQLAKLHEEALGVVRKVVPNWNDDLSRKVSGFAETIGYSREDVLRAGADPRAMLMLHDAMLYRQIVTQQKTAAKKAKADITPQGKPLTPVAKGRSAPATAGLSDSLSPEEWQRRRIAQRRGR